MAKKDKLTFKGKLVVKGWGTIRAVGEFAYETARDLILAVFR